MKRSLLIFILLFISQLSFSQGLLLEGIYHGKDLEIKHLWDKKEKKLYCKYLLINKDSVFLKKGIDSTEIDPKQFGIKEGDSIIVDIPNSTPQIINYKDFVSWSNYDVTGMKMERDSIFTFTTTRESGHFTYRVQQFRWNKWIYVASVKSKGDSLSNSYSVSVPQALHSGEMLFRVRAFNYLNWEYTPPYRYNPGFPSVTWELPHNYYGTEIVFSVPTKYEVYDKFGEIILKGYGKNIDIKKYPGDVYYLNYDNNTAEFIKGNHH